MSLSSLPIELNCYIVNFIQPEKPEKFTVGEIKSCARKFAYISLFNKGFDQICSDRLISLKKIYDLVTKYNKYNNDYENPGKEWGGREFDPKGNPQLLDALFTGCKLSFAESTFNVYTPVIEQDIKDIVKLTPQSLNCILGILRCRNNVPPLAVACFNVNIPLHIVEFLLQQGANPNATLKVNGHPTKIFKDLRDLDDERNDERFAAIRKLFSKYGAV